MSFEIPAYRSRLGRSKPVIAVLALNSETEITDFVVPFGVLSRSGVADVHAVSTEPGLTHMRPLTFRLGQTLAEFNARYPEGADYTVVPREIDESDPALLAFITEQAAKGGVIVSVCLGAMTVANTGLMNGRHVTTHWNSERDRVKRFPDVLWEKNIRYLADGNIISTAGISASLPASIALVEAIAGHESAAALAADLGVGVGDWSQKHNSEIFASWPRVDLTRPEPKTLLGISVSSGDDEISLALVAQAYSFAWENRPCVLSNSSEPIILAGGLVLIPDKVMGIDKVDEVLPTLQGHHPQASLDLALADIAIRHGHDKAKAVAGLMEYAGGQY